MPWHKRRIEFDRHTLELLKAREKMRDMQTKAVEARTVPNTSSMTARELSAASDAHETGVLNAEREAREASEQYAAKCREFRKWCAQQRESIPLELEAREFNEAHRAEGQTLHKEIVERLLVLKEECPEVDDPLPRRKATRM
jgi:hypothetical protein